MVNVHMKPCSAPSVIRETDIKPQSLPQGGSDEVTEDRWWGCGVVHCCRNIRWYGHLGNQWGSYLTC